MSMSTLRTFLAIDVTDEIRDAVAEIVPRLRTRAPVRWVAMESLHVTLNFLGDVRRESVEAICQAAAAAAARYAPFEVKFRGLGAFPSLQRPGTLWIGVRRGGDELRALQAELTAELQTIGFPPEARAYTPHLTIGKVRSPAHGDELSRQLAAHQDKVFGVIRVTEVVVYSSDLHQDGPIYTPLGRTPLRGAPLTT